MYFSDYVVTQVILESLPISSSGHLRLLGLTAPWWVDFCAHLPTVVMLLFYTAPEWFYWLVSWRRRKKEILYFIGILIVSGFCTGVLLGLKHFLAISPLSMAWGWGLTSLLLLSLLRAPYGKRDKPELRDALFIGVSQGLVPFLSVSRLAFTLVVGAWCGLSRKTAFFYSCALQIPSFLVGVLCGCLKFISIKDEFAVNSSDFALIFGAMVVAYIFLKIVQWLFEQGFLWIFGIYMGLMTLFIIFFKGS